MDSLKEKALEKLEKELKEKSNPMESVLADWLKQQNDEELFKGILEPKKTIQHAKQFAYNKARELQVGGCAIVENELVYLWITTYYKEPVIVFDNKGKKEQQKKESHKSKEKPKFQCINKVKSGNGIKKEEAKSAMMEGEQLDLLSFL